jgi:RND family efflux transporter MFP subunit
MRFNNRPTTCQQWRRTFSALVLGLLFTSSAGASDIAISGFTEPAEDSALGLSANGRVTQILTFEGAEIEQGQLLLSLDQDLERLESQRRKLLRDSKAEIESIQLQVKTIEQQLQGTTDLFRSTGSISGDELNNKKLEYAFATAELQRLQTAEQREIIEYETAQRQLNKRNLYAPFSGHVVEVMVGVGEICELDTELIRVVDSAQQFFVANIELPLSQQLAVGQQVTLAFENTSAPLAVPAQISFISPVIDPASGLRKIKAKFTNPNGKILPGSAGTLHLENIQVPEKVGQTAKDTPILSVQ